jgi:hypothetical protein
MQESPLWEADSRSAIEEFYRVLWNPDFHYRVHSLAG